MPPCWYPWASSALPVAVGGAAARERLFYVSATSSVVTLSFYVIEGISSENCTPSKFLGSSSPMNVYSPRQRIVCCLVCLSQRLPPSLTPLVSGEEDEVVICLRCCACCCLAQCRTTLSARDDVAYGIWGSCTPTVPDTGGGVLSPRSGWMPHTGDGCLPCCSTLQSCAPCFDGLNPRLDPVRAYSTLSLSSSPSNISKSTG